MRKTHSFITRLPIVELMPKVSTEIAFLVALESERRVRIGIHGVVSRLEEEYEDSQILG